ncbi:MAG: alanine dehydrogenase [Pseudomonadales bacterium]
MLIGVPREIKEYEFRVGITPAKVRELVRHGHRVLVETDAARPIGLFNGDYERAGAEIAGSREEIYEQAELVVKVKEPQPDECKLLKGGQTLFTYLHLAADSRQARLLQKSGCTAIAYETVTDEAGGLPLLAPMSEVAGRLAVQAGTHSLEITSGGRGVLLGGVPGVESAKVVVIGGGVVGTHAARIARGMGARVTIIDNQVSRLRQLDDLHGWELVTIFATEENIEHHVMEAELVIGAVLVPGAAAPKLVTRDLVRAMKSGSVLVDVAIDQGGCFETSHPTTHGEPTFIFEGVVHYCVANMPGAVPRTAAFALNNATLPFTLALANKGVEAAIRDDEHLRRGLNVYQGQITHPEVAKALGEPYSDPQKLIA